MNGFFAGLTLGLVAGSVLSYLYAQSIVTKTIATYKRVEAAAAAEMQQLQATASKFVSDVKKDL